MPPVNPGTAEGRGNGGAGECLHSQEWKKALEKLEEKLDAVAGGLEMRDLQVEALPGWSWVDIPYSLSQLIWDRLKFGFSEPVGLWRGKVGTLLSCCRHGNELGKEF